MEFAFIPGDNDYVVLIIGSDSRLNIQVEMYKMSTDSWMIVDCTSFVEAHPVSPDYIMLGSSVFLNGSFHWTANIYEDSKDIVCFNLKDEELGLIETLEHDIGSAYSWQIAMIEESLAVLYGRYNDKGHERLWGSRFVGIKVSNQQLLNGCGLDEHVLYLYDLDTREMTKLPHLRSSRFF